MSPVDESVLVRKLALIEERLDLLKPFAALSLPGYRDDPVRKKGAEKLLQEIVNAAVDANYHVLVQSGGAPPADAHTSFLELSRLNVLTPDLARETAPFAGLRNILVHEYEAVDDDRILAALRVAQRVFPLYVKALRDRFCPPPPAPGR
jgi:uncharacterized protein YutE (UPF0331/DUF86 family)